MADIQDKKVAEDCRFIPVETELFSDETIVALGDLGAVLMRIHKRLLAEGYEIKDGKITKKIDIIKF